MISNNSFQIKCAKSNHILSTSKCEKTEKVKIDEKNSEPLKISLTKIIL